MTAAEQGREQFIVIAGWLCEVVDGCTCGTPGCSYPHEQYCGVENIVQVDRLLADHEALTNVRALIDGWQGGTGHLESNKFVSIADLHAAMGDAP